MEAAEGEAVVEKDAVVGDVGCGDGGCEFFAEALADGEIDAGVRGQVGVGVGRGGVGVAVGEAGAVVDVGGGGDAPGERGVEPYVEGVALIVIDRGVAGFDVALGRGDGDADEAAGDGSALLGDLVGVGEMGLSEVPEARGAEAELPGANEGAVDGDGKVDAGVTDVGVVEEVVDAGLEGVDVEYPATKGDLDAELVLFVAFAVERSERGVVLVCELHDWARCGEKRWRLVVAAVEGAEDPVQFGDADGYTETRVGCVFAELALKVGLAQAGDEGEPGGRFEVVGDVLLDDAAAG